MSRRGSFPGGMMPGNMNNLMKQAQKLQKQMEEKAKEFEAQEFEGSAGGGAVLITISGKKEVLKVKIEPSAVDADDVEMLEDLISAAVNEALRNMEAKDPSKMGNMGLGAELPF